MPAQAATVHEVIKLARAGPAGNSPFPRAFNKIIHVGCSMGSLMANVLNVEYPTDVDATILTGFSKQVCGVQHYLTRRHWTSIPSSCPLRLNLADFMVSG